MKCDGDDDGQMCIGTIRTDFIPAFFVCFFYVYLIETVSIYFVVNAIAFNYPFLNSSSRLAFDVLFSNMHCMHLEI